MSTQNEQKFFYQWFESLDLPDGIKIDDMQYVVAAWNGGRAPLLSRIAELEEQLEAYPADWRKDSSLETWFPLTAEQLSQQQSRTGAVEQGGDELVEAVEQIDAYFRSGNEIPVERATIRASDWQALRQALANRRCGE